MTIAETIALIVMLIGALFTLAAAVGLYRFPDALTQLHAVSKPQILGLALMLLGVVIVQPGLRSAGLLALVLLAQMVTMPAASTMMGRAGFRQGLVQGSRYAIDELTPRLASDADDDDDADGFIDEEMLELSEGALADSRRRSFPENVVGDVPRGADLSVVLNWDEPEVARAMEREVLDIDEDDAIDEATLRVFSEDLEGADDPAETHEADPDEETVDSVSDDDSDTGIDTRH
ncbi:monovalent cation/H(+) antiporter subunit G [Brachybacterium huguangmaarense]